MSNWLGTGKSKGLEASSAAGLRVILVGFNVGVGVIINCLWCSLGDFLSCSHLLSILQPAISYPSSHER